MPEKDASQQLDMARQHLDRVQTAAWDPIDWTDLQLDEIGDDDLARRLRRALDERPIAA